MHYRHASAADRGDLDAVLVSAPGRPTLPVRLTLELFGRALEHVGPAPVTVWDPCCGAGTTLAVLGLCRAWALSGLVGTDIDPSPLDLARRNTALLDPGGLAIRAAELDTLATRHGKVGYSASASAARRLTADPVPHEIAVADATDRAATAPLVARHDPRVVIADLPHGIQTHWAGSGRGRAQPDHAQPDRPQPDHAQSDRPQPDHAQPDSTTPDYAGRAIGWIGAAGPDPSASDHRRSGHVPDTGTGRSGVAAELVAALAGVLAPDAVIVVVGRGRTITLPTHTRALDRFRVGHRAAALVRAADVPPGPSSCP